MDTTPVHTGSGGSLLVPPEDDPPFVDRVAEKVRTLAAVKPALVRLLEWQIDQELDRATQSGDRVLGFGDGSGSMAVHVRRHDGHW